MNFSCLKFKTIVLATDLGETTSVAFEYAKLMARACQATLVLVHVIDPIVYAFPDGPPKCCATDKNALEEFSRFETQARRHGVTIHSTVQSETVRERILQAARDHHADLLILGTLGTTEVGRLALGTVTRQLVVDSDWPILTVSPAANLWSSDEDKSGWQRVLAATDFSPSSIAGLTVAMQIAHKKLLALHVTESQSSHRGYATCQQKLEALAPVPAAGTAEVEYQVASGNVGQAIADAAEKFEADLVVLGSPTNRLTNLDLQTSNVVRVISKVNCPIFCVPCQSVPEATAQTKGAALVG